MKNAVSEGMIRGHEEDGYVAIEGFLDAEELEVWRRVTDRRWRIEWHRRRR